MKKPKVFESTSAFDGMYSQWSDQGMQCCIFPRDDNDSLTGSMQCQSQWSSLVKHICSVIKENQKEKLKAWLCRYHAVGTGLNDFILLWQALCYDQYCSTLHTIITWFVHSTWFAGNDDTEEADDNEVIDESEWGVLDDKFYKWPLYQWLPDDSERGGDMMVDFLHKFFNCEINRNCTSFIIQLPQQILDEHPPNKRLNFLLTIHIPLKDNNCIEKNHDGVHTMNEQPKIMMLKDIQLYCCRGINKSCTCRQLPMKTLSFKKVPTNDNYPVKGIFLNEWPYKNHDPRKQDQLASTTVESYYGQQQQQQSQQ